jgi:hypothetical protein
MWCLESYNYFFWVWNQVVPLINKTGVTYLLPIYTSVDPDVSENLFVSIPIYILSWHRCSRIRWIRAYVLYMSKLQNHWKS